MKTLRNKTTEYQTSFRLTKHSKINLERIAKKYNISKSMVINILLDDYGKIIYDKLLSLSDCEHSLKDDIL
jgi:hypothetical protein